MPPFLSRRGFLYLAHRPLLLPRVCHLPQRLRICKKELNEFLYFSQSLSHCLCGWCSRWPFLPRAVSACVSLWPWASATSAPCPALQLIQVLLAALPEPEHPVFLTMCFSTGFTGICRCCCPPPSTSSLLSHRTFPDLDLAGPHHGN